MIVDRSWQNESRCQRRKQPLIANDGGRNSPGKTASQLGEDIDVDEATEGYSSVNEG